MSTKRLIAKHRLDAGKSDLEVLSPNAVYHVEQALEHIILALAQSEGILYPRTSKLDTMARALPEDNLFRTKGSIVEGPAPLQTRASARWCGHLSHP
ncbi:HEPN domain-containing protein [Bradyrhizobium sp. WSM 1738]|nr:HEPN domain-containing protein [Bradyrhizobium hereditatis]